jgi:hypothetical protein
MLSSWERIDLGFRPALALNHSAVFLLPMKARNKGPGAAPAARLLTRRSAL